MKPIRSWISRRGPARSRSIELRIPGAAAAEPVLAAHVLSLRPLIVSVGDSSLRMLHLMPADFAAPCCFLHGMWWTLEVPGRAEEIARHQSLHLRRRPRDRFISLCNAPAEVPIARAAGLEAVLAPHNAFANEAIFRPLAPAPPLFDAVLNAAWRGWKRHELAAEIPRLALVGYFHRKPGDDEAAFYEQLHRRLPHATFCNDGPNGGYEYLRPPDVNAILNRARVGLCLSAIEGGNFASIEYMLSGLPVVSTPSQGGRDYFFDSDFCLVVPPDPRAIRDAAAALAARAIPRSYIRGEALERVAQERRRFIGLMQDLYDAAEVSRSFAREWPALFVNKLLEVHASAAFWRDLGKRLAAPDGDGAARRGAR